MVLRPREERRGDQRRLTRNRHAGRLDRDRREQQHEAVLQKQAGHASQCRRRDDDRFFLCDRLRCDSFARCVWASRRNQRPASAVSRSCPRRSDASAKASTSSSRRAPVDAASFSDEAYTEAGAIDRRSVVGRGRREGRAAHGRGGRSPPRGPGADRVPAAADRHRRHRAARRGTACTRSRSSRCRGSRAPSRWTRSPRRRRWPATRRRSSQPTGCRASSRC